MRTTSIEERLDLMLADAREYALQPLCLCLPEELMGLIHLRGLPDTYREVPLYAVPGKTLTLVCAGGTIQFEATHFTLAALPRRER